MTNPAILVEVLSEGTEAYDRGSKAAHYRRIPSLLAYVFVSQAEPRIEEYRRADAGGWLLSEARGGESAAIEPLGIRLDVNAVYVNPLNAELHTGTHETRPMKATLDDGLRALAESSELARSIRIELDDDYLRAIAIVEALPENQSGADKSWVWRMDAACRAEIRKATRK